MNGRQLSGAALAVAAFSAFAALPTAASEGAMGGSVEASVHCYGVNACKGHNDCKTDQKCLQGAGFVQRYGLHREALSRAMHVCWWYGRQVKLGSARGA